MSVDLGVSGSKRRPAFVQHHDPVALLDLGAQQIEAVGPVILVIAAGVDLLDAGFPDGVKPADPAITRLSVLEPSEGVPRGCDLGEFGVA